jgi:hypothetical protein
MTPCMLAFALGLVSASGGWIYWMWEAMGETL